jgi:DNA-binding transcriptional MocR family regulator
MPTPWTTRIWQEYRAGNLTRAARDVLLTLHTFRGTGGQCWPSHATLAERAQCCVRTVQRALAAAQALGLVSWAERRVRAGWRWLRSSNLYRFAVPVDAVQPIDSRASRPSNPLPDSVAGKGRESKKEAREEMLRAAAAAPDLLAMRRAAFTGGHIRTARMA